MKLNETLLAEICDTPGISGFEEAVQEIVARELSSVCDELSLDAMGNLTGVKKASSIPDGQERAPRVMLAAHADEIGMMVKHIADNGCITFERVGGLLPKCMPSQYVVIHGDEPVNGVIVPDTRNDDTVTPLNELLIDCGLSGDQVRAQVEIGSPITFAQSFSTLNEQVYAGRNFDNRLGTFCLIEAMKQVGDIEVDVFACSTVQEEVGVRGAGPAAFAIDPDIGLAIDGGMTWGGYIEPKQNPCELGGGAAVYVIDGLTIGDPRLVRFLLDLGRRHDIVCQRNLGGGTDASQIQRSRAGVLSTTVGAPVRYMHSTVQLAHQDDIVATIALLKTFLEQAHRFEWPPARKVAGQALGTHPKPSDR